LERWHRTRELALLNLGIDSKLRGCDLVALKLREIQHGAQIAPRAIITQHKTGRPVQFEIAPPTRAAVQAWVTEAAIKSDGYLFPSRIHDSPHICARQYARMLRGLSCKQVGEASDAARATCMATSSHRAAIKSVTTRALNLEKIGGPCRIRTYDQRIKSPLLYQLS
jgi:integrase